MSRAHVCVCVRARVCVFCTRRIRVVVPRFVRVREGVYGGGVYEFPHLVPSHDAVALLFKPSLVHAD